MSAYKKLKLIPAGAMFEAQRPQPPVDPVIAKIDVLNKKMQKALAGGHYNDEKVKKYRKLLSEYLHYYDVYKTPKTQINDVVEESSTDDEIEPNENSNRYHTPVARMESYTAQPSTSRQIPIISSHQNVSLENRFPTEEEVNQRISLMVKHPDIVDFNSKGQLIYKNLAVPDTNVLDLLAGEGKSQNLFDAAVNEALQREQTKKSTTPIHTHKQPKQLAIPNTLPPQTNTSTYYYQPPQPSTSSKYVNPMTLLKDSGYTGQINNSAHDEIVAPTPPPTTQPKMNRKRNIHEAEIGISKSKAKIQNQSQLETHGVSEDNYNQFQPPRTSTPLPEPQMQYDYKYLARNKKAATVRNPLTIANDSRSLPRSQRIVRKRQEKRKRSSESSEESNANQAKLRKHDSSNTLDMDILRRLRLLTRKRKADRQIGPAKKFAKDMIEREYHKTFRERMSERRLQKMKTTRRYPKQNYMKDNARLARIISKARGRTIDAIKKPTKRPGNKQSRLSRLARKRSNIHGRPS